MSPETIKDILDLLSRYEDGSLAGSDLAEILLDDSDLPDELEAKGQAYLDEYKKWLSDVGDGGRMGYDPDPLLDAFVEALEKAIEPTDEQYRLAAQHLYAEEGTLEFDDEPVISKWEGETGYGAYVQAWVWVDLDDAHEHGTKGGDS